MDQQTEPLPTADVGVLLVHGIGDHREGETLLSFGEPLIDWIRDWMRGGPKAPARGTVSVETARLRAIRTERESPAYADVIIEATAADASEPEADAVPKSSSERWRFVEAWWGESVQAPSALRLFGWMLSRVPLLVWWHFFGGAREAGRTTTFPPIEADLARGRVAQIATGRVPDPISAAAKWLTAPLLILGLQLVIAVAMVLLVVPIGPWRTAVAHVVRTLTLTLGDSYVLLEQDVQHAALVQRVRHTLDWLAQGATRIIVVAHSQGGAVAHDALRGGRPIDTFVTVGSGLEKLVFLRLVREHRSGLFCASCSSPALAMGLIGLVGGLSGWLDDSRGWWLTPLIALSFGVIAVLVVRHQLKTYTEQVAQRLSDSAAPNPERWFDVHASLDLVPMGSTSVLASSGKVTSVGLRNESSLVSDHVSYFRTPCGFNTWFWLTLSRVSALKLFSNDERQQLHRLATYHSRKAFALGFGTLLAPLSVLFAVLTLRDSMDQLGQSVYSLLAQAQMGLAERVVRWASETAARVVGWPLGLSTDAKVVAARGQALLAAVCGLAALVAWWALLVSAWRADGRARWRNVCCSESWLVGKRSYLLGIPLASAWLLAAAFPLFVVIGASQSPQGPTFGSVGRVIAAALAMACAAGAAMSLAVPWLTDKRRSDLPASDHVATVMPLVLSLVLTFGCALLANMLWKLYAGHDLWVPLPAYALVGAGLSWALAGARHGRWREAGGVVAAGCGGGSVGYGTDLLLGLHQPILALFAFAGTALLTSGWRRSWAS